MASAYLAGTTRLAALLAVGVVALSSVVWSTEDTAHASSFAPAFEVALSDAGPGASSDIVFGFDLAAPDANFRDLVTFAPPQFDLLPDGQAPLGALAGTVKAGATLGLLNNPCNDVLDVEFQMFEASTDITRTIPLYAGVEDFDGNGLVENIDRYPSFLTAIAPNIEPVRRLYGQLVIAGLWTPLNFVVYEPGTRLPLFPEFDESLGYPIVVYLLDPIAPIEQSAISDFCTPLSTTTTLFSISEDNPSTAIDESGHVLHRNPDEDGSYAWTMFARSRWDADGDGIENDMDPCPYDPDPDWDPRSPSSAGDADGDGLPASCDPDDTAHNIDQDGDTWLNRLDLCPLVATQDLFFQYDTDNDGVGDECDPDPTDPTDGGASHRHQVCLTDVSPVGAGGQENVPPCPDGPDLPVPPLMSINAAPALAVGQVQSLSVRIGDSLTGTPYVAVPVEFEVTGANTASGSCLTNNFGRCEFNYQGDNAGTDTVTVSAFHDGLEIHRTLEFEWLLPPPNDDFESPVVIDSLPFQHEQTLTGAGSEQAEPLCGGSGTVWYSFTPEEDLFLQVSVTHDYALLTVAGFVGSDLAGLEMLACDYPFVPPPQQPVIRGFHRWVEAGETYYLQVSNLLGDAEGTISLHARQAVLGDANCDGGVDATDALAVLMYVALSVVSTCLPPADVNCDGALDVLDALEILRRVAGLSLETACT